MKPDPELSAALEKYDLGRIIDVRPLTVGMFARPLVVVSRAGRFVFRPQSFRTTEDSLRFQAHCQNSLASVGDYAARMRPDRHGSVATWWDGKLWALHEYVQGQCYDWQAWKTAKRNDPRFLREVGRRVARVHDLLSRVSVIGDAALDHRFPPIQWTKLPEILGHWNGELDGLAREKRASVAACRDVLLQHRTQLEKYWQKLTRHSGEIGFDKWPQQIIHGDVSPVNMVFGSAGKSFKLIDWECCHLGLRLYDALGDVLNRWPVEDAATSRFQWDEVAWYLSGYRQEMGRPFTEAELEVVPVFCLARQMEDLRQRLQSLSNLPPERDEEYARLIKGRVRMMDEIAECWKKAEKWHHGNSELSQ